MQVKIEIAMGNLNLLHSLCWDGAKEVISQVIEEGKSTDFIFLLEQYFWGKLPTMGELNDFIWFDVPETLNLYNVEED